MEPNEYDVTELARAAGVSPRTVRYYVREKLLMKPGTRGPAARYPRSSLDRLRLIKQLQHEGWALAKIRERIFALGDDGVAAAVAGTDTIGGTAPPVSPEEAQRRTSRPVERQTWERIKLTPSVEVNFRRPLVSNPRVDKLVRAALEIFGDEP